MTSDARSPQAHLHRPVLVVEDSDEDFETMQEAFARTGLPNALVRVESGGACLELLRGHGRGGVEPALVVLDLNTPGLDGREALAEIRGDERLRALPVVVLSTSSNPRDLEGCYRLGANAYHVKPIRYREHLETLVCLVTYWLGSVALPEPSRGQP